MGTIQGELIVHKDETGIEVAVDWAPRHEVISNQTISSPQIDVLDADGDSSNHLTVNGLTTSGSQVQFTVDVGGDAVEGAEYELVVWVTLSGGARIYECLTVTVESC